MPTHIQHQFATQKDAIAYIGYKGLKERNLDLSEKAVTVSLEGDTDGNIHSISMEVLFRKDDINIQIISNMYTWYAKLSEDYSTVVEKQYYTYEKKTITVGTNQWLIATSTNENHDRISKDAYMIKDKIEYSLNVSYNIKDADEAEHLLNEWMNLFS